MTLLKIKEISSTNPLENTLKDPLNNVTNNTLKQPKSTFFYLRIAGIILAFIMIAFLFWASLEIMVRALHIVGEKEAKLLIKGSFNPFLAVFGGILITAIVQSSSLVTSMIVAMVASGVLSMEIGINIVMGANIGTTLTCMMVSLAYPTRKKEFKKAFAGSLLHVFFNILSVFLLFPIEYYFGGLSWLSGEASRFLIEIKTTIPVDFSMYVKLFINPIVNTLLLFVENGFILLIISFLLLFLSLRLLLMMFKNIVINRLMTKLEVFLLGNESRSLFWGILITAIVRSSSVMTSWVTLRVASNQIPLKSSFAFILGANIGTTITALLATIGLSNISIQIAMAHILFNVLGVALMYILPFLRNYLIFLARYCGHQVAEKRILGVLGILLIFFIIPFLLIYFN